MATRTTPTTTQIVHADRPLTPWRRFLFGGAGALLPVLLTILSIDVAKTLADPEFAFTDGNVIGIAIRYIALFVLGGFVAYLHSDENKPLKLVEIGIAAPALITSLVAANAARPPAPLAALELPFISSAHAQDTKPAPSSPSLWNDVVQGITGQVYVKGSGKDSAPPPAWVSASGGQIPDGAPASGRDRTAGSRSVYVCRAEFKGSTIPGRIAQGDAGCLIGWDGNEHTSTRYEILTAPGVRWSPAKPGTLPERALKAGEDGSAAHAPIYACRTRMHASLLVGRASADLKVCKFVFAGRELRDDNFEVLVE